VNTAKGERAAAALAGSTAVRRLDLADLASIRFATHNAALLELMFAGKQRPGADDIREAGVARSFVRKTGLGGGCAFGRVERPVGAAVV